MISPETDFLAELYETCLSFDCASYDELGERLVNSLGLAAVSVWSRHPYVPQALSQVVFFQHSQEAGLIEKDQQLAEMLLEKELKNVQGSYEKLYYLGMPLWGKHAHSALLLWSAQPFSESDLDFLEALRLRLTVLLDLMVVVNPSSSNRIIRDLENVRFVQKQLMPALGALGGKEFLSYRMLPVYELGGDYLDILPYSNGSVGLTIADAMGKGITGAFVILAVRTLFKFLAREKIAPDTVLYILNNQFLQEMGDLDTFVTQFYGIYDPSRRTLQYANAGHNPPIVFHRKKGKISLLKDGGIALGGKANVRYSSHAVQLEAGDILVAYSDGLPDIQTAERKRFGKQGIAEAVMKYKEYGAEGICDGLVNTVLQPGSVQRDDLSLFVLKVD